MTKVKQAVCPNCEQEFDNSYGFCPHCGQQHKKLELNIKFFLHDFLSSSFNLDSKIFQTLKLLIFYPGKLTKNFLAGKRTSYLPPVRLYLVISLVYFTLLSFLDTDIVKFDEDEKDVTAVDSTYNSSIAEANELLKILPNDTLSGKGIKNDTRTKDLALTLDNLDEFGSLLDNDSSAIGEKKESGKWKKIVADRLKKFSTEDGRNAFQTKLRNYISVGMFVLMPLTALIFFMLFYRKTYYIQHLVFVLHLQSMMFLLFTLLNLLELLVDNTFTEILTAALFFFILFIWIKNFYETGWGKAIWKSILFLFLYSMCFSVFMLSVALISAWNF